MPAYEEPPVLPGGSFSSGGIEIRLYDATRILLKSVRRWNRGMGNIAILEKMYASYGFQYIDTVEIFYEDIGEPMHFRLSGVW